MTTQTTTLAPIGTIVGETEYTRLTVVQHVRLGAVMGWAQLERCDYLRDPQKPSYRLVAKDGSSYALLPGPYGDYTLSRSGSGVIANESGETMRLSFWASRGYEVTIRWARDA